MSLVLIAVTPVGVAIFCSMFYVIQPGKTSFARGTITVFFPRDLIVYFLSRDLIPCST